MDQALSCRRFVLYIKPHKKTPSRREITIFSKVSKMTIFAKKRPIRRERIFSKSIENGHFSQKSKGVTKVKFSKMANFLVNLKEAKKIGIQVL